MNTVVPRIAAWSSEQPELRRLRVTPDGLTYKDGEQSGDRDALGFLWVRHSSSPGIGAVQFSRPHPTRQREAMTSLTCQVCSGPATTSELGVLWLLHDHWGDWPYWPEGMGESEPPVCETCVPLAAGRCPSLRSSGVALYWVGSYDLFGVQGKVMTRLPRAGQPIEVDSGVYAAADLVAPWVLAYKAIRRLRNCTPVKPAHARRLLHPAASSPAGTRRLS